MKTLLGQYEILSELGSGGMGVVYRALDIELQRTVALKRLRSEFAASPAVLERFRREAQLQGRLNHPNIAQLHSLAQTPDAFCIVMELIEGVALKALIPMSWQEAGPILLQVLDGLGYAHSQGVLHRDIKPENILIDRRGTAKVMDFGIAHAVGAQRLTREKALIGTIEYMPPERIQGGQVDNRSDIYSIGMVLFEVLTGRLPYSVTSEYEVMKWHVESAPPPLSHFIQAPAALDEIVQKASAKRPEDRYASCEDMAAALRLVYATRSPDPRIVPVSAPNGYLAATHSVPAIGHPLAARPAAPTRLVDPEVRRDAPPETAVAVETPEPTLGSSRDTGRRRRPWKLIAGGAIVLLVAALALLLMTADGFERKRAERFRERQTDIAEGNQALLQKNYVVASEYFHQALTLDPGNPRAEGGLLQIQQLSQDKAVRDNNLVTEQSTPPASGSGVAGLDSTRDDATEGLALFYQKRYEEAKPLLKKGCTGGEMTACNSLGWLYQNGWGVAQDYGRALALYKQACTGGEMTGCNNIGWLYQNGWGVAQDYGQARTRYEQACTGRTMVGCNNLGWLYQNGLGVAQDYGRARALYEQACTGGEMRGCNSLGQLYQNGWGVAQDYGQARTRYEQVCTGRGMVGCNNLGWLYQNGLGVAQDYGRARAFYKQACTGGEMQGCNSLGWFYQNSLGVAQDYDRARIFYKKACDERLQLACDNLHKLP
jgi:serine/threonine protein kinase/TPR repeat protein